MSFFASIAAGIVDSSTPLLFAVSGTLVMEKAGVLNLGVEGMLVVSALAAYATGLTFASPWIAIASAVAAGMLMASMLSAITLIFRADPAPCGIALSMFGLGVTALAGAPYAGTPLPFSFSGTSHWLESLPGIGPWVFSHHILACLAIALVPVLAFVTLRTRTGLLIRAVGDDAGAAQALGLNVRKIRWLTTVFGGALIGLGGGYLSTVLTPLWAEGMSGGRGWIAVALVAFSNWRFSLALVGSYLFGGIAILQLHAQAFVVPIPIVMLDMAPYIVTIVALVCVSGMRGIGSGYPPGELGKKFLLRY